jgi:integrase
MADFDRTAFEFWMKHQGMSPATVRVLSSMADRWARLEGRVGETTRKHMKNYALAWKLAVEAELAPRVKAPVVPPPDVGGARRKRKRQAATDDPRKRSFTDDELARLLAALPEDKPTTAVIRVMEATGLRVADVLRIDLSWLRHALKTPAQPFTYQSKGQIKLATDLRAALPEWRALGKLEGETVAWAVAPGGDGDPEAGGSAYQACWKAIGRAGRLAKIEGAHLHRIRRTVLVQVRRATGSLAMAQQVGGHADIDTTAGYTREVDTELAARALKARRNMQSKGAE